MTDFVDGQGPGDGDGGQVLPFPTKGKLPIGDDDEDVCFHCWHPFNMRFHVCCYCGRRAEQHGRYLPGFPGSHNTWLGV
jgi:hypothetical protein